jgi:hypothetical protein
MKPRLLLLVPLLSTLIACASGSTHFKDPHEDELQQARVRALPITGGFTFKQYVTPRAGDKEVLGTEGVIYISPTPFTDADYDLIKQNKYGKRALLEDLEIATFVDDRVADVCIAGVPRDAGQAGEYGRVNRLKISAAFTSNVDGAAERFKVEGIKPIFLSLQGTAVSANGADIGHAYGWSDARLELTRDPSVNLNSCLALAQDPPVAGGG